MTTTETEKKLAAMGLNTSADFADNEHNDDEIEEETLPAIAPMSKISRTSSSRGSNDSGEKPENVRALDMCTSSMYGKGCPVIRVAGLGFFQSN